MTAKTMTCSFCGNQANELSRHGYPSDNDTPNYHCPKCGLYQYLRNGRLVGRPDAFPNEMTPLKRMLEERDKRYDSQETHNH